MPRPIGILYPGHSAEDDYPDLEARLGPGFAFPVRHTVMTEDAHRLDALLDWGRADHLADGARALAPLCPAAVVWACTSGSFAFGWDGAHEQVAALADVAGVPATSTSLAFVSAALALGVRSVAVVATYPADVAGLFVDFLRSGRGRRHRRAQPRHRDRGRGRHPRWAGTARDRERGRRPRLPRRSCCPTPRCTRSGTSRPWSTRSASRCSRPTRCRPGRACGLAGHRDVHPGLGSLFARVPAASL